MTDSKHLKQLFKDILDLTEWTHIVTREDYAYGGIAIPGLRQEVYCTFIKDTEVSVGVFYYNSTPAYLAWGLKEAEHCSYHARLTPEGKIIEVVEGCPNVVPEVSTEGVVTGFALDHQFICSVEKSGSSGIF